jgi:hypothetical protein
MEIFFFPIDIVLQIVFQMLVLPLRARSGLRGGVVFDYYTYDNSRRRAGYDSVARAHPSQFFRG